MRTIPIPDTVVHAIRDGRATLVLGGGLGARPWDRAARALVRDLRARGEDGDTDQADEIAALCDRGELLRALAALGRALGGERCRRTLDEEWAGAGELDELHRAALAIPVSEIWTTAPAPRLERALAGATPAGEPPRIVRCGRLDALPPRSRVLVELFDDGRAHALARGRNRPPSWRDPGVRAHVGEFYTEGCLVLVGFAPGDPDLDALLRVLLSGLREPQWRHCALSPPGGRLVEDELWEEHRIELVPLCGAPGTDTAIAAAAKALDRLRAACERAGATLSPVRPEAEDLDGWLAALADDPFDDDAGRAVDAIEVRAREQGDGETLVKVLSARVSFEGAGPGRAAILRELARTFEDRLGDVRRAETALLTALREDPYEGSAADEAERLAGAAGDWAALADALTAAAEATDDEPEIAAGLWSRLGRIFEEELGDVARARACYRRARQHRAAGGGGDAALRELERAAARTAEPGERARLLYEAAVQCDDELEDPERSLALLREVLALEPEHAEAGLRASEQLLAAGRAREARPILEMLARRAAGGDPIERGRRLVQLGRVCDALGEPGAAASCYRQVEEADPDNLSAAIGLSRALDRAAREDGGAHAWEQARRCHRRLLTRHRIRLTEGELVRLWHRCGVAARRAGDVRAGVEAQKAALVRHGRHAGARAELASMAAELGDTRLEIWLERRACDVAATEDAALAHLARIGDLYRDELDDPVAALEVYLEGLGIRPGDRPLLDRALTIYTEQKQWSAVAETLEALAACEPDPARRAELADRAAAVARDGGGGHLRGVQS